MLISKNVYVFTYTHLCIDFVKQFEFQIGVQAYSNVGHSMAIFIVNVGDDTVTPNEYVENEIRFNLIGFKKSIVPHDKEVDTSS